MIEGYLRVPRLDLAQDLYQKIIEAIDQSRCEKGQSYLNSGAKTNSWFEKLIYRLWFGRHGYFQVYRLPDQLRDEIINRYQALIDAVGETPKIRLKSSRNIRRLVPHSDGGDKCSITIGIRTNDEETRWFNRGRDFKISFWNLLTLSTVSSVRVKDREAYVYDNQRVHDMKADASTDRFLLVLSWDNIEFEQLKSHCESYT